MQTSWYFIIGFAAQGLFSARMLIQWILSEKARKVVSPVIYWQLSLLGSFLFFIYGWLRGDFAILLGQLFSYYIYIWNLNSKDQWKKIHSFVRFILALTPLFAICIVIYNGNESADHLFDTVSLPLLLFGSAGQLIFTFRFIYQWLYSKSRGESLLPAGFWILSLLGSFLIVVYGIFREDPVLILGQSVGFITYSRNLWLITKTIPRTED
jgi:Predicted membrane protein